MQFNEKEKVLQLFSESGRENAEGYFVTLGSAPDILDFIAAGNPEHAVALYRAAFDRALPITNSMWMDHLLLLTTEKSVSDIAAELGFASASHLGSLFKQQEGLTPRQYRLQQRQLGK